MSKLHVGNCSIFLDAKLDYDTERAIRIRGQPLTLYALPSNILADPHE
jgi:hypothetical protein